MNPCKYWHCGWCYAPDDVKTNATHGECIEPNHCPYLKSQMPQRDIKSELCYSSHPDYENGRDIETIDFDNLISPLEEILDRLERLEK